MSDYDEMDLAEQVARLTARVAELEERLAQMENNRPSRSAAASPSTASGGEPAAATAPGGEEMVAAIKSILDGFGEADAGLIRQELVKNGFPASLTRSEINKMLYRHTDLFARGEGEVGKPEWRLI